MTATIPSLLLALAVQVYAAKAPPGHEWHAPGAGDVRSPCPGINTAANHGFIPRSEKNISVAQVASGLLEGLNIGLDFGLAVGQTATLSNANPLAGVFNMDDLREHNFPLEHDVSLSRQDFYQGDDLHFNQSVFDQVLAYYDGATHTTFQRGAKALWNRLVLSLAETSLYMSLMGNPVTGDAPVDWVKIFFEQERLPYEEGWVKPSQINFATLGAMAGQLLLADPLDPIAEGLNFELVQGAVKDVFQLRDPITGVLINATCALAGLC
ncbi:hypothetical protein M409DRAFT_68099 [Zasmidium cellare ATCC 36951]|uniref:Heme haloperoxidase family profile domain-containing protein n=1 Tax=Zasmidium cellare ATCC 36951 TaxID=1080233 RepID=A0A6A6CDE5_ZASCE|nr:uncharacterized protein M409DRAFT_68099 [Zasmidium cellare ATCC 36951]KAF2164230.1 hypothetical protein M409DRAFT_68099 [Zasmidium cellare ATCC 36951]